MKPLGLCAPGERGLPREEVEITIGWMVAKFLGWGSVYPWLWGFIFIREAVTLAQSAGSQPHQKRSLEKECSHLMGGLYRFAAGVRPGVSAPETQRGRRLRACWDQKYLRASLSGAVREPCDLRLITRLLPYLSIPIGNTRTVVPQNVV